MSYVVLSREQVKAARKEERKAKRRGESDRMRELYGPLVSVCRLCTGCGETYETEQRENEPFTFFYCWGCQKVNDYWDTH